MVNQYLKIVKEQWRMVSRIKKFRQTVLFTFIAMIPLFFYLNPFLDYIERRPGCEMNDILLNWIPAIDLSNFIFFILYSAAAVAILYCMRLPWLLFRGIQVLIVLQYMRNICLYVTPLNAPVGIVALQDPVLETIAYNHRANLKDLFFSGHTATIFIFMLLTWNSPGLKFIFGIITGLMAILLLIQHCHYTVDIIGGIACAYLAFKWVSWIWLKIQLPLS